MTILILLVILAPGLIWLGVYLMDERNMDGGGAFTITIGIASTLTLVVYLVLGGEQYVNALKQKSEIDLISEKITVYEKQQEQILENIKTEASKYADWESKTFKELKPDNVTILFNAYPNLRTVEIITQYVAEIKNLQAKKFEQQIREIDLKKELRYYRESILTFIPL